MIVLTLLFIDCITNPYAGIVHDARLYAIQSLSHLHPQRYQNDLFFLYGSQDSFTIFSFLYAPLIKAIGLQNAAITGYLTSRLLFLYGALSFMRAFCKDGAIAATAAIIIAAGQLHYVFFDLNEPFLTPRLAAHGLSLLACALFLNRKFWLSLIILTFSSIIHPLITLEAAVIITIYCLREWSARRILIIMALSSLAAVSMTYHPAPLFDIIERWRLMDKGWLDIVLERSYYLDPVRWTADEWRFIISSLLLSIISLRYLDRRQRVFAITVIATAASLTIIGITINLFYPLALMVQLQLWRALWLLRVLTIPLSLLTGIKIWQTDSPLRQSVALLILLPGIFFAGAGPFSLPYFIGAALILLLPRHLPAPRFLPWLTAMLPFIIQGGATTMQMEVNHETVNGLWPGIMLMISILKPLLRPIMLAAGLGILCFWQNSPNLLKTIILASYTICVVLSIRSGDITRLMADNRNISMRPKLESGKLRNIIPPGSLVLTDSLPIRDVWFSLRSASYFSAMQGAGIVFNRRLACAYHKREQEIKDILNGNTGNIINWCRSRKIDFVVTRARLNIPEVRQVGNLRVYTIRK